MIILLKGMLNALTLIGFAGITALFAKWMLDFPPLGHVTVGQWFAIFVVGFLFMYFAEARKRIDDEIKDL